PGDRLHVLPAGYEVRVRSVQVHGAAVERAEAGRRVALAVAADRRRRPEVGDALVTPGSIVPTYRFDAILDEAAQLPARTRVTVSHPPSRVPARLARGGEPPARRGGAGPLAVAPGDRFVLRQETTIGGGRVLASAPPRRLDEDRLERLEAGDLGSLVDAPVE